MDDYHLKLISYDLNLSTIRFADQIGLTSLILIKLARISFCTYPLISNRFRLRLFSGYISVNLGVRSQEGDCFQVGRTRAHILPALLGEVVLFRYSTLLHKCKSFCFVSLSRSMYPK